MSEHKIRNVRIFFFHDASQGVFILHHGAEPGIAPVAPGIVHHGCFAVSHVVVGSHNKACIHKFYDHVEVPSGVFTKAVHQLYDTFWLGSRHIDPALHLVPFVVGWETYFM